MKFVSVALRTAYDHERLTFILNMTMFGEYYYNLVSGIKIQGILIVKNKKNKFYLYKLHIN